MPKNELVKKIKGGSVYVFKDECYAHLGEPKFNDIGASQHYYQYIPAYNPEDDKVYMIDTYHIDSYYGKSVDGFLEQIKGYRKDGSGALSYARGHYYSNGTFWVDANRLSKMKPLVDLAKFEKFSDNVNEYNKKDVVTGVRLFWECGYPYGWNLLRRGAKRNPDFVAFESLRSDYEFSKAPRVGRNKEGTKRLFMEHPALLDNKEAVKMAQEMAMMEIAEDVYRQLDPEKAFSADRIREELNRQKEEEKE